MTLFVRSTTVLGPRSFHMGDIQGTAKKNPSKTFCIFLSNCLEFQREILVTDLFSHPMHT